MLRTIPRPHPTRDDRGRPEPGDPEVTMSDGPVTDADVAELVEIMREAASAYIGGDIRRYFDLMHHADDFTLMDPFGGDVSRDTDASDERVAGLAQLFHGGECVLDVVETYASGNLAVLVAIERQHGDVGGYDTQDWSLRVTLVFRREGSGWRLAHRHADPIVHPISFDQVAALARGAAG
jgi:ketosteroid isomerase-like protein